MSIRNAIQSIARGAKGFAREFKREYGARQLAAGYRAMQRHDKALAEMSPEQQAEYHDDVNAILSRAHELAKK